MQIMDQNLKNAYASTTLTAIQSGTAEITDSSDVVLAQTGTLTWSRTNNVLTSSDPAIVTAGAAGTAARFKILSSAAVEILRLTVGTSAAEEILNSLSFTVGVNWDEGVITITF